MYKEKKLLITLVMLYQAIRRIFYKFLNLCVLIQYFQSFKMMKLKKIFSIINSTHISIYICLYRNNIYEPYWKMIIYFLNFYWNRFQIKLFLVLRIIKQLLFLICFKFSRKKSISFIDSLRLTRFKNECILLSVSFGLLLNIKYKFVFKTKKK